MTSGQSSAVESSVDAVRGEVTGLDSRSVESSIDLGDDELNSFVADGMEKCEKLLIHELDQGASFVTDKVKHLALAGGKRVRPTFALLASRYGERPGCDDVIKAAIVVEMTHLATLYHDDVMDEANRRRGVDSANARWGNSVAILAGDALLAHSTRLMSTLGMSTVRKFSDTFEELVTGQMRETIGAGEANPVEHYRKVIWEKTAVLIALPSYLGATHAGAPAEHAESLERLGGALGMIFQIIDDIIDIFSESTESGKTPGTDLREGVFTLPVLYALEHDSAAAQELRGMLSGALTADADVEKALELIKQTDGRERALADVDSYRRQVVAELDRLPAGPANEALRRLTSATVERVG